MSLFLDVLEILTLQHQEIIEILLSVCVFFVLSLFSAGFVRNVIFILARSSSSEPMTEREGLKCIHYNFLYYFLQGIHTASQQQVFSQPFCTTSYDRNIACSICVGVFSRVFLVNTLKYKCLFMYLLQLSLTFKSLFLSPLEHLKNKVQKTLRHQQRSYNSYRKINNSQSKTAVKRRLCPRNFFSCVLCSKFFHFRILYFFFAVQDVNAQHCIQGEQVCINATREAKMGLKTTSHFLPNQMYLRLQIHTSKFRCIFSFLSVLTSIFANKKRVLELYFEVEEELLFPQLLLVYS